MYHRGRPAVKPGEQRNGTSRALPTESRVPPSSGTSWARRGAGAKNPGVLAGVLCEGRYSRLSGVTQYFHLVSARPLGILNNLKLDAGSLFQRAIAIARDAGVVDEDVLTAAVAFDEAIALLVIEPLDLAGFQDWLHLLPHRTSPPSVPARQSANDKRGTLVANAAQHC